MPIGLPRVRPYMSCLVRAPQLAQCLVSGSHLLPAFPQELSNSAANPLVGLLQPRFIGSPLKVDIPADKLFLQFLFDVLDTAFPVSAQDFPHFVYETDF